MPSTLRHTIRTYGLSQVIAGGGDVDVVVHCQDLIRLNMFLRASYDTTDAGSSGPVVTMQYGSKDPANGGAVVFAENSDPVNSIIPTELADTNISHLSEWNVDVGRLPEYLNIHIENSDPVNDMTYDLWADQ